jgi:hypothetical protein
VTIPQFAARSAKGQFSAMIDNERKRFAQIIKDRKITVN